MKPTPLRPMNEFTAVSAPIPRLRATSTWGLLLALSLATTSCRIVRVEESTTAGGELPGLEAQVSDMLAASAEAWNRGDLEAFMSDYARAPSTTYIGGTGLKVGFDAIRARYAPTFALAAERDSLRFESLRVRSLESRYALATARYVLQRGGETTASGPFTLVLSRIEGRWMIIHDHSSSDPPPESAP